MTVYSSVSPSDYSELNTTLMLSFSIKRRCVDVTIVNDLVDEPDENFFYNLERTPGLPQISLQSTRGEIEIVDDDG